MKLAPSPETLHPGTLRVDEHGVFYSWRIPSHEEMERDYPHFHGTLDGTPRWMPTSWTIFLDDDFLDEYFSDDNDSWDWIEERE